MTQLFETSFYKYLSLHLNFAKYESFLESNFPNILALCETNLDDSTDSGNLYVYDILIFLFNAWQHSLKHAKTFYGIFSLNCSITFI